MMLCDPEMKKNPVSLVRQSGFRGKGGNAVSQFSLVAVRLVFRVKILIGVSFMIQPCEYDRVVGGRTAVHSELQKTQGGFEYEPFGF
jgi:hypothetical protein